MLEHTSTYFNASPLCDEGETFPDFYTRLGPCELQEPVWAKMSSALAAGVTKKRKKSDTKPQAQINKCQNEKRRREQENIYIEELAELISANFADMSSISVKPDKCAILQETVNQIRNIKQRENASQSSDPVQQGEVSSSRPTILTNEIYGPLLLEALEGFLFVVNAEGKVEHVTENVSTYIKYTRDEVLGKSIYNFIHHGDHTRFSSNLLPMSIGWASEPTNKSRSFSCRLLVKSDDQDESMEEKQQRVSQYEVMHISSTQLRQNSDEETASADSGPCLLCVASRITYRDKVINAAAIEQFTTKLDTSGKIIGVDVSGISVQYSQFLNKNLTDSKLQDLCVPHEVHKLTQHLKDTLSAGQATSGIYRLRLGQDKYVQVQTKSKLFKPNPNSSTDTDFVMATHSIITENDCTGPSDPGGGTGSGGVGGPLMTSVVNGTRNGGAPASSGSDSSTTSSSNNLLNANSTTFPAFALDNDSIHFNFSDIFPTSTWEQLDSTNWPEARPDSRQSVTPASTPTPRPPSAPAYSPAATTVAQSPLGPYAHQPSPTVPNNPPTPYSAAYASYSPMGEQQGAAGGGYGMDGGGGVEQKPDTKVNVLEEATTMMADSARLRNLLTKPPNSSDSGDSENRNKNTILKGLLNQPDEDDNKGGDNRGSPRIPGRNASSSSLPGTSELPKTSTAGGMLLQLLNEKSDDDDVEARAGLKKRSELLQELMKKDDERKPVNQGDTLLQSLGFNSSPSPPGDPGRARKRPSEDQDDNPLKRSSDGSQVSSSGSTGSKLCEKNKMLASLLAITPSHHQPIPPIPASVISATPQEKLPRITDPNLNKNRNNNINQQTQQQNAMNSRSRVPGRPPNSNYLNQMLTADNNNLQRNHGRQYNQVDSSFTSPATSSTDNNNQWVDPGSDPLLSIILDQVIDIVPDAVMTNPNDIQTLLEAMSPQANSSNFQQNEMSERMAINMIQKSLMMQCEPVAKSPSSPTITSPAYPTNTISQPNQGGFPPPPNYPRMTNVLRSQQARPGASQYPITTPQQQQLLIQQQRKHLQAQQENRRRLLERQSQQQLLIPSNAEVQMNSGLQNIDSLLNNTVAPNVSLQRSSSVPESQLSPTYQLNQSNQRISGQQQQPYSPHSQLTSPIGGQSGFAQSNASNYQQGGARLSPHPPFNQQLSPRQAYPQQASAQNNNWQQATPKLSVQQQQNPMLNAQLTGNYVPGSNGRGFPVQRAAQQQQQQPRAVGSPGTTATRHSPFPVEQFPPPASPNSGYNQSQYLRLQRTNSAPTATTQLPGGLGSPRPFARDHPPHSYPSIPPNPHHPMMYQQESQYCYDQTSLQLPYNGADRGRAPPHLQAGVSAGGGGPASEYVRQELRAVVGARTGQQIPSSNATRTPTQQLLSQNVNAADLEALGLSFEMPSSGASESPKLWGAMGSDMGSMSPPQAATSRNTMEEGGRQGDHKSSLLQKLLSE